MYEQDLATFEDLMRRLKVEYDIFFNGNRKRPPDDLRGRLETLVKKLSQASNMTFSERFQFNTLVARFSLYRDLWRRTMSKQEVSTAKEDAALGPKRPPETQKTSAESDQEFRISIANPESEPEKVRNLYDALVQFGGPRAKNRPALSYEQFSKYIVSQTQAIRSKYKCTDVVFSLNLEEDAIKFRATAK